ncbi:voltage-gated potassium channel [Salinibacter ruber]|jgi:voltage-gated potassium channel|uniref:ion transporter n=1 Tax=Salinibacter ruber TaxID=146919 RepID=UPI000E592575|nr:ion transporter [Salinibacter ruber]MCS3685400.1 voltage-gated potassium channel [Salinibacter ruber]MCS3708064.1 voltage-gated potassium channel [Salinibacter ruber]MCS3856434.1 voltage-gated potassium channel [Salinibacter ruber]MCS4142205.1 voltage-gated potassium channel [Salinibacter ruber]MCS4181587.1 voltage-gated potassium channel [Salinibacter ruber]
MTLYRRLREKTWKILSTSSSGGRHAGTSTVVSASIFALILLNVIATILGTVDRIKAQYGAVLRVFEIFSVLVFTVEYVLRVWSCVESEEYNGAITGRLGFVRSFYAVIDLAAIAPFYVSFGLDLRFARVLRLLRVFRLVKAARYFSALRMFGEVVRRKREEITVSLALLGMLTVVTSSLMYYAERAAQPEVFSSIPDAIWWSVVTVTTVGYGNATPVTVLGQMLGGLVAVLGTGMGALPAGFLASGFSDALESESVEEKKEGKEDSSAQVPARSAHHAGIQYCPHCGSKISNSIGDDVTGGGQHANGETKTRAQDDHNPSLE